MNSDDRLKAIFLIWAAFALATIVTVWGRDLDAAPLFMTLFYAVAAASATHSVMQAPVAESGEYTKTKRRNVERMLSSLSDDELDHLRERLSTDDGEMVSLDALMRERRERG